MQSLKSFVAVRGCQTLQCKCRTACRWRWACGCSRKGWLRPGGSWPNGGARGIAQAIQGTPRTRAKSKGATRLRLCTRRADPLVQPEHLLLRARNCLHAGPSTLKGGSNAGALRARRRPTSQKIPRPQERAGAAATEKGLDHVEESRFGLAMPA